MSMYNTDDKDCTKYCKSTIHGKLICSALTKRAVTDVELSSYINYVCHCSECVKDDCGRNALHIASSCGRTTIIKWLITAKNSNVNVKDIESGYTPLHRSIFYGKINSAVTLMQCGANFNLTDNEDLTPFEHAMKDNVRNLNGINMGEVYVWGTNTNYTLGPQQERNTPEILDVFHREYPNVAVKQVCLDKFHCVLVTSDGKVYSCGHGQGGRLGQNIEQTVLTMKPVFLNRTTSAFSCKEASIAKDHSVFLTESGQVWSCGLNTHHVLGHGAEKILAPKQLFSIKNSIDGICTGQFHTVAWWEKGIYTFGLNGGQLGHDKTCGNYITHPKLVSNITRNVLMVDASDGATCFVTTPGDVFVLHEYQTKKIASKILDVHSVKVFGGKLNFFNEKSTTNDELKVFLLTKTGNVHIWSENDQQLRRCIFSTNRTINVKQIDVNRDSLLFVTRDGEAFCGKTKTRKQKVYDASKEKQKTPFHKFVEKDECIFVKITKIPNVHRAVSINSDPSGGNCAVIQVNPRTFLKQIPTISPSNIREDYLDFYEQINEWEHDVIMYVAENKYYAHGYILSTHSATLRQLIETNVSKNDAKINITINNVDLLYFEEILKYIYTGNCDLITVGKCPERFIPKEKKTQDPLRKLQDCAKKLEIASLHNLTKCLYYENEFVKIRNNDESQETVLRHFHPDNLQHFFYEYTSFPHLYDVNVKTKDNKIVPAHKCILSARLEYFNNLFSLRWNEKNIKTEITLQITSNLLKHLLDFLYTDRLNNIKNEDIDSIWNLLILSDQLFIRRLKQMCELIIIDYVTLKTVVQTLELSKMYNANNLTKYCMEFICVNLTPVLESRHLERYVNEEEDILNELTEFYYNWNPLMCRRVITPYSNAIDDEYVVKINKEFPVAMDEKYQQETKNKVRKGKNKSQRNESFVRRVASKCEEVWKNNEEVLKNDEEVFKIDEEVFKNGEEEGEVLVVDDDVFNCSTGSNRLRAIKLAYDKLEVEDDVSDFTSLRINDDEFPELSTSFGSFSYSKSPGKNDVNRGDNKGRIVKLSQKQRKRLSSSECSQKETVSESPKNPWKMSEIVQSSPILSSPIGKLNMDVIMNETKMEKVNYNKMKTKSLLFTQMEDKALDELAKFYNVCNVYDEIITAHRVQTELLAAPTWIQKNK